MKKTIIVGILFIISVISVWFFTRTFYRVQYFEIAKEHYMYREAMYCDSLNVPTDDYAEALTIQKIVEGCQISVGMLIEEFEYEVDEVVFFGKNPQEAYEAAKYRAVERLKHYYHIMNNPVNPQMLIPQDLRDILEAEEEGL